MRRGMIGSAAPREDRGQRMEGKKGRGQDRGTERRRPQVGGGGEERSGGGEGRK